jgi:ketosteroid isomerase-like protein
MSRENVKVVRSYFEAWNAGNMDAVREMHAPDVVFRTVEEWPEPGPYVGREAVMRFMKQLRETWDVDSLKVIGEPADTADRVVVRFIWSGEGHGPEPNFEMTHIFTVRKGKIRGHEFFWDHAEALEALGLSEKRSGSEENLEVVRRAREAFNSRDLQALEEMSDPELEFISALAAVDAGENIYRGPQTWARYFARMDETWDDWQVEDFRTVDAGEDRVVAIFRLAGTGKSSGASVERTVGLAYWLRQGKLWRMRSYLDPGEALEAVGLTEEDTPAGSP